MNPMVIGGIVEAAGEVLDDLITTDEERRAADLEELRIRNEMRMAELEADTRMAESIQRVNEAEANHASIFVAGWRPAVGWIAALALGFNFILQPLMVWGWSLLQGAGIMPASMPPPDALDISDLIMLLAGMLGMGTLRTVEKMKGVARDRM